MSRSEAKRFEEFIRTNSELKAELSVIADKDAYLARCVHLGKIHGYEFTADDYHLWKTIGDGNTGQPGTPSTYSDIVPRGATDTTPW